MTKKSIRKPVLIILTTIIAVSTYIAMKFSVEHSVYTEDHKGTLINESNTSYIPSYSLQDLVYQWQCLFYYTLLKQMMTEQDIHHVYSRWTMHDIESKRFSQCLFKEKNHFTNLFLLTVNTIVRKRLQREEKSMRCIRRYIMIISKFLNKAKKAHDIHNIFNKYNDMERHNETYFMIHISKSAGTSICQTAGKQLHYRANTVLNCNIVGLSTPMSQDDFGSETCTNVLERAHRKGFEIIAKENPMHGHNESLSPTLCNEFVYIMPIRHPLKRIASTLAEFNLMFYWPLQLLVQKHDHNSTRMHCNGEMVSLRDRNTTYYYTSGANGKDFDTFVSEIFENEEHIDPPVTQMIDHDNKDCVSAVRLGRRSGSYTLDDKTYLNWFAHKYTKYAIKITDKYVDRINISLFRGYLSNIYTRFIGYQHRDYETVYDALYAKSYDIDLQHLLNAIDLMMQIEYVLPFDGEMNGAWRILYRDMLSNSRHRLHHVMNGWRHEGVLGKHKGEFGSSDIYNAWSSQERDVIIKKNLLDIQLYKIAQLIADTDVEFHEFLQKT